MRGTVRRTSVVLAMLAVVAAIASYVPATDVAHASVAAGRSLAVDTSAPALPAPVGMPAARSGSAPNGGSPVATGSPGASANQPATPHGTSGPAAATPAGTARPAQLSVEPAIVGAAAVCDSQTGTWDVAWQFVGATDTLTVTTASDPINNVTATQVDVPVALWWPPTTVSMLLPGSASTAAVNATLTLPDKSTYVERRNFYLGGVACTQQPAQQQPAQVCDPLNAPNQFVFSVGQPGDGTAGHASMAITGSCAGPATGALLGAMSELHGHMMPYSYAEDPFPAPTTREILTVDLPPFPCAWTVDMAGAVYSGGNQDCVGDDVTVVEQCPQSFVVTLQTSATDLLPTTFAAFAAPGGHNMRSLYHLAPGQSVTVTVASSDFVDVAAWNFALSSTTWKPLRNTHCAAIAPSPASDIGRHPFG